MKFYLDEDSVHEVLIRLLRKAGHDVESALEAALAAEADAVHLTHAIHENRTLLSQNHEDFEDLHDLIAEAKEHHPGILIVRRDNDPRRDLTPRGVLVAITKLIESGVPITDQYHLNHWR